MKRESGLFLHITSLPSEYGIGDLGNGSKQWIDHLAASHQKVWQICPIGPTGYGYSPYMSLSAFAGNPLLISPQLLRDWGYLNENDLIDYPILNASTVEFHKVELAKEKILRIAFTKFVETVEYHEFLEREKFWVEDWALFMSLTVAFGGKKWIEWDHAYRTSDPQTLASWSTTHSEEIRYHKFVQFMYHSQWFDMKQYAHAKGVKIFGDIPFYVAYDSCDVWANQEVFELDAEGVRLRVGGVPPDYFSEDGQLWGNPLFRWDFLAKHNYQWWIERMRRTFYYCDIVRIDHFRAFEAFWAIPGDSLTAKVGEWVKGPDKAFFTALKEQLGECNLIAEDLGIITDEVVKLRLGENLPGMKVLQFAFDGNPENWYLPFNCSRHSVMYTGTHDNDTTVGWRDTLDVHTLANVMNFFDCTAEEIPAKCIREVLASVSALSIIPLVDVLHLDGTCRFNVPGIADGNWAWRFTPEMIDATKMAELGRLTKLYGRA